MTLKEEYVKDVLRNLRRAENGRIRLYDYAMDEIEEALHKQIPKRPIEKHEIRSMDNEGNVTCEAVYFRCPVCNKSVQINRGCSNNDCRQAIDWSDE